MSDKPPALPGPVDSSGAAAPGTTAPRSFRPTRTGSYRREGRNEFDAAAEIARRRRETPRSIAAPRGATPPPAPVQAPPQAQAQPTGVSPLTSMVDQPLPQLQGHQAPAHPLAPQPPLAGDPIFDLTIGGAPQRVALSELVRGYMRNADYTQKAQQAAEHLRQAQTAVAQFNAARAEIEKRLPQYLASFGNEFAQLTPEQWIRLSDTDPIGYAQKRARKDAYDAAQQEMRNLVELRQREDWGRKGEMKRLGHEYLMQVLPGWRDPATREHLQRLQAQYLRDVGYAQEEIDGSELLDPRQIVVLEEARRFRAIVAHYPELLGVTEIRPEPPARRGEMPREMPGAGRSDAGGMRAPRGEASLTQAERNWADMADRSGAAARDAAVAVIAARRRAATATGPLAPLRPTRGRG